MSTKQLRRLAQQKEVEKETRESEEEESDDDVPEQPQRVNKFALLMEDGDDKHSDEDKSEDEKNEKSETGNRVNQKKTKKQKKKKNKKKANDEMDEIDELLKRQEISNDASEIDELKKVMGMQWPDLNPDNELKKVLGAGFKKTEQKHGARRTLPQYRIIQRDPRWPQVDGSGLSVVVDENFPNPKPGYKYYKFVHNSAYQEQQQLFWDLMDNQEPDLVSHLECFHFLIPYFSKLYCK